MAYDLKGTDLFYVDRGGTLFQVTWQQIFNREKLQAGDLFLVQREDRLYQVDIKDLWDYVRTIEPDDFLEVEREFKLYHVHLDIPPFFAIRVSGYDSSSGSVDPLKQAIGLKLSANSIDGDDVPKVQKPDGSFQYLTAVETEYEFDQNGIYRFSGDFTNWKVTYVQGNLDAGLTPGKVWNGLTATSTTLGTEMFNNIDVLYAVPDKLKLVSLEKTFVNTGIAPGSNISSLDTSAVTNATYTFQEAFGSGDVSGLNVSNVTNMAGMFLKADISVGYALNWDVRKVTDFSSAFQLSTRFDADLSSWDPAAAVDMGEMFRGSEFNGNVDGSGWASMNVMNVAYMFAETSSFNQPIGDWRVANVKDFTGMFVGAQAFNQNLRNWDVSKGTTFLDMFRGSVFAADVSLWNTHSAMVMQGMFAGCAGFQ